MFWETRCTGRENVRRTYWDFMSVATGPTRLTNNSASSERHEQPSKNKFNKQKKSAVWGLLSGIKGGIYGYNRVQLPFHNYIVHSGYYALNSFLDPNTRYVLEIAYLAN